MYCVDTLKRLNEEAVQAHRDSKPDCEYCDEKATETLEIFNPADALRDPPVEGAYCTVDICEDCHDNGVLYESYFFCPGCGEWFVRNHSWDVLSVSLDDGEYCQKCAAEQIEPVRLWHVIEELSQGNTEMFIRINSIPGKEEMWSGEFSQYSDFPGHTSFSDLALSIQEAAGDMDTDTWVYPIIDHGYQFSVSLAIYH